MRASSGFTCWAHAKLGVSASSIAVAENPVIAYFAARSRKSRRVMRPWTKPSKSFRTSGGKSLAFMRSMGASWLTEELQQLGKGFLGHLLGGVVPAWQHFPMHVGGALAPRVHRLVAAVHVAPLAPQH